MLSNIRSRGSQSSGRVQPAPSGDVTFAFRDFEIQWAEVSRKWLPFETSESPWRSSHRSATGLPLQGWKLHVSATILSAPAVLEAVAPLLHRRGVLFKGPKALVELRKMNCGLFYGFSQIGKFLTVYPRNDDEASSLAAELHAATRCFKSPAVPFERPVANGSSVFVRYGLFAPQGRDGNASMIRTPDGKFVADARDRNPSWAKCPPGLLAFRRRKSTRKGALGARFRAYESLSQRGKGGVYRALDLGVRPARLCALKEGRSLGEVDWDGSDGRARLERERETLAELRQRAVPVPEIYAHFVEGENDYLAMEWIDGTALAQLLLPDKVVLELDVALHLAAQCADLLARIHDNGWVWRDLKPANLIYEHATRLRPIDFEGAARVGTQATSPWGTVGYLPPEWMQSTRVSFAQDCYALGVTLHQLFTNHIPTPDPLPDVESLRPNVPALVKRLIADLTLKAPQQRMLPKDAARELKIALNPTISPVVALAPAPARALFC